MDNAKTNSAVKAGIPMDEIEEDRVFTVIRNKTKNQKVVLSSLGGIEIAPGQTVNLRERYRKAQLFDAAQEIFHFIDYGALEDLSNKAPVLSPTEKQKQDIASELQKKVDEAKKRDYLTEIQGCSLISRLEDLQTMPGIFPEVIREAKIRYMQIKGWIDDNYVIIEGAMDDNNQPIESVDNWVFKP